MLEQVSVFAENKKGRLAAVMKLISESGIDIRGLNISDTTDFGIIRMVVNDAKAALKVFKDNDCIASSAMVPAFRMEDKKGAMYDVIKLLDDNGINIEYCYSLMGRDKKTAHIVIKTNDAAKTEDILKASGITLISEQDIV